MFAIIATYKNGVLDDAYICADVVARWHKESREVAGYNVVVRRRYKTEASATKALNKYYPT